MAITRFLRIASDYLARRKGLPVLIGVVLICLNLVVTFLPPWPAVGWFAETDVLLHVGAIVALISVLLGDAL